MSTEPAAPTAETPEAAAPDPVQADQAEPTAAVDAAEAAGNERERKERVLHTRVPAVLEAELKRFADNLRIPVSNLVRTILEDAVMVADRAGQGIERELRTVANRVGDERAKLRSAVAKFASLDDVYGFQPLVLNLPANCARCGVQLVPGTAAHVALSETPGPRRFVCDTCLPGRTPSQAD
ncbi:MAG: hypothetical protein HY902_07980 [Deltaproteobacteria bacterium]|nr:hypothetical protein [Deltaproteobacteria bacterium]